MGQKMYSFDLHKSHTLGHKKYTLFDLHKSHTVGHKHSEPFQAQKSYPDHQHKREIRIADRIKGLGIEERSTPDKGFVLFMTRDTTS